MTKLEEEILKTIEGPLEGLQYERYSIRQAKAAAEVAKKYILRALDYDFNGIDELTGDQIQELYNEWLKENGII